MRLPSSRLNKAIVAAAGSVVMAAAPIVANFEGWRNTVYGDKLANGSHELSTVCAGHTDRIGTYRITKDKYSDSECTVILVRDIQYTDKQLRDSLGDKLVEEMPISRRVALIDFIFNLGIGTFNRSSIPHYIKNGEYSRACGTLLKYDKATRNGVKVTIEGLQRRRDAEYAMCIKND